MTTPITFVSLGAGDPELITLKALKSLQVTDIIYCPSTLLKSGKTSSRAMDILLELNIEYQKIRLYNLPMSKDRTEALNSYKMVAQEIAQLYKEGKKVAVTSEGDAGFYSSSHYIIDELNSVSIPSIKLAGIPAFIASGALANIHVVKQEEELHVVPGVISAAELKNKIDQKRVVVIMKTSQSEQIIKQVFKERPKATIHYFENVGLPNEFYTQDRDEIECRKFPYFSLIIIHP